MEILQVFQTFLITGVGLSVSKASLTSVGGLNCVFIPSITLEPRAGYFFGQLGRGAISGCGAIPDLSRDVTSGLHKTCSSELLITGRKLPVLVCISFKTFYLRPGQSHCLVIRSSYDKV